jgi:DNA-binding IclR family transcriptional regulator
MSPEAVEAEIAASIKRGWFQSLTEFTPDVVGVSVSLPVGDRRLSLFVAGPAGRLREKIPATAAIMQEMVARYLRRGE